MSNPLLAALQLKLPGRSFTLPSQGALYNKGELESPTGDVHIQAMSALDEITLKNSDLLFNGEALTEVLKTCAPSIKSPKDLYGRDIDALMIFLRLVTYGPEFAIKVKHDCENAQDHDYVVDIEQMVQRIVPLDPTDIVNKYTITLDNGQVVQVHPVRYADLISLFQDNMARSTRRDAEGNVPPPTVDEIKTNLVKSLTVTIKSVDGIEDRNMIAQWVAALTTRQQNQIADAVEKTNAWGPESVTHITCKDCGKSFPVDLPLNPISFFTE